MPKGNIKEFVPYIFPEINVLILDKFYEIKDYKNILKLDLKKYFNLFAKDSLLGSYSK